MSDFDKEAEREKLREKYGEDDDETDTRRMSELLLKGATMTNGHCEECNDPLFRHNGQTFCATCQANGQQSPTTQQGDTDQPEPAQQTDDTQQHTEAAQQTEPAQQQPPAAQQHTADTQQPTNSTQPADERPPADASQPTEQQSTPTQQSTQTQSPAADQPTAQQPTTQQPTTQQQPDATDTAPQHSPAAADLTTARQSLVGTITRFSQQAAKADDPRRAKELLAAAREAAETLRALEFE
jgi:uncharacterized Zn finger protein (UPF0148 family)